MLYIWFDALDGLGSEAFAAAEWRWCRVAPGHRDEGRADLGTLAAMLSAQPDDVSLLLESRACLHLRLKVPPMTARNLTQALPYIAEEQVAQPVEAMHFAIGQRQVEYLQCMAISRFVLQNLLQLLVSHGIQPVAACSDAFLMRAKPGVVVMLLDGDRALLRTPQLALESPRRHLSVYLPSMIETMAGPGDAGVQLHIMAEESAETTDIYEAIESISGIDRVEKRCIGSALAELVTAPATSINLLTGDFAPRARRHRHKAWRLPVALAALWLVLMVAADLAIGIDTQERSLELQEASLRLAPGARSPEDVIRLVQREQGVRSQATGALVSRLAEVSEIVSRAGDGAGDGLTSLTYASGAEHLDIEVRVADYESLEELSNRMQVVFVQVDMLGATQEAGHVRARLRLHGVTP